jgi:hypothetical protein
MASIVLKQIVGVGCDDDGKPERLLVFGTALPGTMFAIRFAAPSDPISEETKYVEGTQAPAELEVETGMAIWCASFDLATRPLLQNLRSGAQPEPLKICALTGHDKSTELVLAPFTHILRDRYQFDTGVLFVHGMGGRERGETLWRFAGPILDFLQRWFDGATNTWLQSKTKSEITAWQRLAEEAATLRGDWSQMASVAAVGQFPGFNGKSSPSEDAARPREAEDVVVGTVTLDDVALASRPDHPGAPANAAIQLCLIDTSGAVRAAKLLFAEAFWVKSIVPPTFREMLIWSLLVAPMLVITQAAAPFHRALIQSREAPGGLLRIARAAMLLSTAAIYLLFTVAFAILAELFIAILLLVAIIPIKKLRSLIIQIQAALLGTIGEGQLFATSPMPLAAMIGETNYELNWLCKRCRQVIVVAHSQGAAIAHYALRRDFQPEIKSLITLGSGLAKLDALRREHRWPQLARPGFVAIIYSGFAVFTVYEAFWLHTASGWSLIVGLLASSLMVSVALADLIRGARRDETNFWNQKLGGHLKWTDFYASRDPVPNGPSVEDGTAVSIEVQNRASLISDHTTYWTNVEQIVAPIAYKITESAGLPVNELVTGDGERLAAAAKRRVARVRALSFVRYTMSLAIVLFAFLGMSTGKDFWTTIRGDQALFWNLLTENAYLQKVVSEPFCSERINAVERDPVQQRVRLTLCEVQVELLRGYLWEGVLSICLYFLALAAWKVWTQFEISAFVGRMPHGTFSIVASRAFFFFIWFLQGVLVISPLFKTLGRLFPKIIFGAS